MEYLITKSVHVGIGANNVLSSCIFRILIYLGLGAFNLKNVHIHSTFQRDLRRTSFSEAKL